MYEQTVEKGKRPAESVVAFVAVLLATMLPASAGAVDRSGKEVVEAVCIACHGSGANGAPKVGDAKAWKKLSDRGLKSLGTSALEGVRRMLFIFFLVVVWLLTAFQHSHGRDLGRAVFLAAHGYPRRD